MRVYFGVLDKQMFFRKKKLCIKYSKSCCYIFQNFNVVVTWKSWWRRCALSSGFEVHVGTSFNGISSCLWYKIWHSFWFLPVSTSLRLPYQRILLSTPTRVKSEESPSNLPQTSKFLLHVVAVHTIQYLPILPSLLPFIEVHIKFERKFPPKGPFCNVYLIFWILV